MITTRKSVAVFGLVAILTCSSVAGSEPDDANTAMTFEITSKELPLPYRVAILRGRPPSRWKGIVAYAAAIPYTEGLPVPAWGTPSMDRFEPFVQSQDISEEQQRFLKAMNRNVVGLPNKDIYVPPSDPNSPRLLLYAVSLEDAKKMAEAYVRFARDEYNQQVAEQQATIEKLSERVTAWPKRLAELALAEEATTKELEEVRNRVPYRSEQQALDAAAELDKLLNTAQVEIAGIQATLKAIQDQMKSLPSNSEDLRERLEVMFIEESISLQAAEARRRMATDLRKQADKYIDLTQALPRITKEKEQIAAMLPDWSKRLDDAQRGLSDIMQHEPQIIDNKVHIYPIEGANTPAEN